MLATIQPIIIWLARPMVFCWSMLAGQAHGANSVSYTHLDVYKRQILYVTRVQKERFESPEEYEAVQGSYTITHDVAARMKPTASIMHPLPRVGEIHFDVDKDPRAAYFRQMQNGMFMRMALLAYVLGE